MLIVTTFFIVTTWLSKMAIQKFESHNRFNNHLQIVLVVIRIALLVTQRNNTCSGLFFKRYRNGIDSIDK